ncbi:acyl-CoA synthetase [Nocardiopsis gilva YIM 90087]|uniref:Acyl-CoA synthetase n=2 Tax=Nocardiopsis gilva TaxID=280236 RepID=A0A223SB56_9ACTN|nr:acyl-CoA synthetase [Nocardiopsis gilva]ASU85401.1 acyl-CoA synthetase [Nocardiopsis gilva YIM 90087]
MQFNLADMFESIADRIGDRTALVCGDDRRGYAELEVRANRLAHHLTASGIGPGAHVGMQLYNGAAYIESLLAVLKIRAVPVNVNYRYVADELRYLYTDADLAGLVYDAEFGDRVAAVLPRVPTLRHLVAVGGPPLDAGPHVTAITYEAALAGSSPERDFPKRSGDDLYIIYTGGTTGLPKGVMWRQEDLFFSGHGGGNPGGEPVATPEELVEKATSGGGVVMMPVAPLMHGAAQLTAFICLWSGGTIVLVRRFDADAVLRAIERERVLTINLVGDAMAAPLADALEAGGHDVSSLHVISSSGAILSGSVRARLEELLPGRAVLDNYGSTETGLVAWGVAGATPETGLRYRFDDERITVLGSDLRPVAPGSGDIGQVARSGRVPLGYYKDREKTAATFVEAGGVRYTLTGDMATVEADGTVTVHGRGSVCINTGGEKVFPEEIESVLKGHPQVSDAVVVGVDDDRFGQRVAAVVSAVGGVAAPDLDAFVRERVAGYKVPRQYRMVPEVRRSPSGKADYRWARRVAAAAPHH